MRHPLVFVLFLATLPAIEAKPNLLFIYLDDFGWKDAGYMGSDFYETPNIDRLASEGMTFSNAYSASANCAPARACLLSGQYTPRHEIYNVGTDPRGAKEHRRLEHIPGVDTLDTNIKTWAQCAQEAGYATASIGKWHLSGDPIPYGFDINIGGTHSGSPPRGYYPPHPNAPGLANAPENEYLTDRLSDEAVEFIQNNKDRPWLLYLTHFAVHTPIQAKKELVGKYENKTSGELHDNVKMATMVQSVDDGVGEIVETLDRLGLSDNTIVLFFSDNGGYGPATDMAPLYGYKGTYYEGGIRVPLFVKWPGVATSGGESDAIVSGVDLFPTIADMLGFGMPKGQLADGISLVPILKGSRPDPERAIFWHFPAYLQSYPRVFDEQRDPLFRSRPCSIVRKGDWKLHHYYEDDHYELYNLRRDIGESRNLAKTKPGKFDEMRGILKDWLRETKAHIPVNPNPEFDASIHEKAIQTALQDKRQSKKKNKAL